MIQLRPKLLGGYTIIEVMIVLAISGAILASAILLFSGSQGRTAFDVSVQDVNSQLTSTLKEASTSISQFPGQFNCDGSSAPAQITQPASNDQGTNTGCVVLGTAIWPHIGESEIDFYTVVGCQYTGCQTGNGDPANLVDASSTTNTNLLKQTYNISSGTILAVQPSGANNNSSLAGFYVDLTGTSLMGSTTSLELDNYGGFDSSGGDSSVLSCIQNSCTAPTPINQWSLCLSSPYENKTALITVSSSSKGVSTTVNYTQCGP